MRPASIQPFSHFNWKARPLPAAFLLLLLGALGCATVPPGHAAVVLAPSGLQPQPVGEGVSAVAWFGQVTLYDLRQQEITVRLNTITKDGGRVYASASVVTYRIAPDEVVALAHELGPDYAQVVVRPEVEGAVRRIIGGVRSADFDSDHLVAAQTEITRLAAARLRPYHVILESVDLRTMVVIAPPAQAQVAEALILEQRLLTVPKELKLESQRAEERRTEATGLVDQFRTLSPSLSAHTLEDRWRRGWDQLLRAPSATVLIQSAGIPAKVEVLP